MTQVTHGPFKGLEVPESEVRPLLDEAGHPIIRDGKEVMTWGVHHRTKHVLEKFSPIDGWSIRVTHELGAFNIPDPTTMVLSADGSGPVPALQPTVLFVAELRDPKERVIADASLTKVINAPFSWQAGQTAVRGALYDALGLTLPFDVQDGEPSHQQSKSKPVTSQRNGVTAVASTGHESKLAPAAQAMVDALGSGAGAGTGVTEVAQAATSSPASQESVSTNAGAGKAAPEVSLEGMESAEGSATATGQDRAVVRAITTAQNTQPNNAELSPNVLRQAIARAKVMGVEVPQFKNNDELREFYKSLSARRVPPTTNVA
ncbi:hypothetical protein [Rhodanobacter sp. FW106-PBR-LB-2-11]|uniref:hypothetical protein n=1 Tax=Rhodanobacter sp. FW106-PBR-LB-2-11 TaxID=1524463 RepID=UPI0034E3DB1D